MLLQKAWSIFTTQPFIAIPNQNHFQSFKVTEPDILLSIIGWENNAYFKHFEYIQNAVLRHSSESNLIRSRILNEATFSHVFFYMDFWFWNAFSSLLRSISTLSMPNWGKVCTFPVVNIYLFVLQWHFGVKMSISTFLCVNSWHSSFSMMLLLRLRSRHNSKMNILDDVEIFRFIKSHDTLDTSWYPPRNSDALSITLTHMIRVTVVWLIEFDVRKQQHYTNEQPFHVNFFCFNFCQLVSHDVMFFFFSPAINWAYTEQLFNIRHVNH